MEFPHAPANYDMADQAQVRGIMAREDKRNIKAGTVFDKILLRDTVTGAVVTMTVASGIVVIT